MNIPSIHNKLSENELEVLLLIAEGYTTREIAKEISRSADTVKTHTYKMRGKLGASNNAHAVALAYHFGILHAKSAIR